MTSKRSDLISEKSVREKKKLPKLGDVIFVCGVLLIGGIGMLGIKQLNGTKAQKLSHPTLEKSSVNERVKVSRVTGITIPDGAKPMMDEAVVTESAQKLHVRASQLAPNLEIEKLELFIWPDKADLSGHKTSQNWKNESVMREVEFGLKANGFLYQRTRQREKAIYEFIAVSQATKQIVPGFWLDNDEFLLLAWASYRPTK